MLYFQRAMRITTVLTVLTPVTVVWEQTGVIV